MSREKEEWELNHKGVGRLPKEGDSELGFEEWIGVCHVKIEQGFAALTTSSLGPPVRVAVLVEGN